MEVRKKSKIHLDPCIPDKASDPLHVENKIPVADDEARQCQYTAFIAGECMLCNLSLSGTIEEWHERLVIALKVEESWHIVW